MNTDELFELPSEAFKKTWIRESSRLMNVIQKMEQELKRMKANPKVTTEMVEEKDSHINDLVEFYNATDSLINSYQVQVAAHRMNDKLNSLIFKKELNG